MDVIPIETTGSGRDKCILGYVLGSTDHSMLVFINTVWYAYGIYLNVALDTHITAQVTWSWRQHLALSSGINWHVKSMADVVQAMNLMGIDA